MKRLVCLLCAVAALGGVADVQDRTKKSPLREFKIGVSTFLINPEAGAHLLRWDMTRRDGTKWEVLYWPDGEVCGTIDTVFGGAPVFFPFCGISFADGKKGFWRSPDGKVLPMRKFGFADNGRFRVVSASDNAISMRLEPDAVAKESYPFSYELFVDYTFKPTGYVLEMRMVNHEDFSLPWGPGHHPFLKIPWHTGKRQQDYRLQVDCGMAFYVDNDRGCLIPTSFKDMTIGSAAMPGRIHGALRSGVVRVGLKDGSDDLVMIINDGVVGPTFCVVNWGQPNETPFWAVEPWSVPPLSAGTFAPEVAPHSAASFKVELSANP